MKYGKQVENKHYNSSSYDNLERFISYFNQKKLITEACEKINNPTILEIGKGNGFLYNYLKSHGYNIKSFDIAEDLIPDYVGDLLELERKVNSKFDVVCCFEVLEHLKYEDMPEILNQMANITNGKIIISVPQARLYLSLWIKINLLRPATVYLSLPFPIKHKFDGQHYWELGKKNFSEKKFRNLLKQRFSIIDEFTHPLDPYHKYFILDHGK